MEVTGCGSLRFGREERLKGRNEIKEIFGKGKRFGCRGAKLFVMKNSLPHNRICFTFSRGFGNAVTRNRTRRLCREAYRSLKPRLNGGYDMVVLAYPAENRVNPLLPAKGGSALAARVEQLTTLFFRAGVLV